MKKQPRYKTARTTREFKTEYRGYNITVPAGSLVSNRTACGNDDDYRFLADWDTVQLVGYKAPMLAHDLQYYGLNIPAEFCTPYPS